MQAAVILSLILASVAVGQQAQGTLTNQRVGDMVLAGVSQKEIIRIISTASVVTFDLRPVSTDALLQVGVSEDIIKAMAARENGTTAVLQPGSPNKPLSGENALGTASGKLHVFTQGRSTAPDNVSEPEFANVFYRLEGGMHVALERETGTIKGKSSGFIIMSMKGVLTFPGGKSPVRFRADEGLQFVVRSPFAGSAIDPTNLYHLRRLTAKKHDREAILSSGHATPVGASVDTNLAASLLPLAFTRYGKSSYKISAGTLPSGEYAIGEAHGRTVFCFGVD
jgi:hypothetical protein